MQKSINSQVVHPKVFVIRGQKVMLDKDLAELYGIRTRNLNQAVTRNLDRFPLDFMFPLTIDEFQSLMSQIGTSNRGGTRKPPRVFTEQGVAMLSSVLKSKRAVHVNIAIMRAFVRLREILSTHKVLAEKLIQLVKRMDEKDKAVRLIFEAISQLMAEPEKPKTKIGFHP